MQAAAYISCDMVLLNRESTVRYFNICRHCLFAQSLRPLNTWFEHVRGQRVWVRVNVTPGGVRGGKGESPRTIFTPFHQFLRPQEAKCQLSWACLSLSLSFSTLLTFGQCSTKMGYGNAECLSSTLCLSI